MYHHSYTSDVQNFNHVLHFFSVIMVIYHRVTKVEEKASTLYQDVPSQMELNLLESI